MKTSISPFLKFSQLNTAEQLALCGAVGDFSEALEHYADTRCENTIDLLLSGNSAEKMRQAIREYVDQQYGLKVMVYESIVDSHQRNEINAAMGWFLLARASAVLRAMTVAPLDSKHTLRENYELICNIAPEYAGHFCVTASDSLPESPVPVDWHLPFNTHFPAIMLLPFMIPEYGV